MSYMELKRIKQHFELSANSISNYDEIVSIVNNYLDYLNNENYKYLISNCPSLIENFNKTIFAYMEKENENKSREIKLLLNNYQIIVF